MIIALFLGFAAAAGAVSIIEILDDTFKTPEDMEEKLGLSVLGITPLYRDPDGKKTALAEVADDPTSPLSEAYRSLRTALQFSTSEGAPRSLLITSSRPGEGKSTTAACLALNFGQLGLRVLLIDGDMRNPSIHKMLKLDNGEGLSNYLSGATPPGMSSLVEGDQWVRDRQTVFFDRRVGDDDRASTSQSRRTLGGAAIQRPVGHCG